MNNCWVNVFAGPYAGCKGSAPYYISMGYATRRLAINALDAPKAVGIRKRYIVTVKINIPRGKSIRYVPKTPHGYAVKRANLLKQMGRKARP